MAQGLTAARLCFDQSQQRFDQRTLARSIGTEQTGHAGLDAKGHIGQRPDVAVVLRYIVNVDDRLQCLLGKEWVQKPAFARMDQGPRS